MTEAGIAWADLFLEKYAAQLAEQTLEEVFKVNPNDPEAHAAMAEVIVDTRYDLAAVRHHLDAALAVNPKNARALKVRASIEIDQNQWAAANKTLDGVLAVNKDDVEAIAMKATVAWLRDDTKGYDAEVQRALAIDPAYAELYRIVARAAVREHRYVEAIELEKRAVAVKPDYYEAMAGVGLGYLRLGMEKEGLDWLDKSWAGDQYNVRTFNTRTLFKETIPKDYTFGTSKDFRIRYHNDEKAVLARYVEPTMERAFADMVKRYGFTPKTPVTIELYADRNDYGIRTIGLPDIAALGVTFGQVITAMSPANGDINWGMVLWHELGHVFAIQLSNSRVPRWFTEGLSEYETLIARPDWRRENDADLYGAVVERDAAVDRRSQLRVHAARRRRRRGRLLPVGGHHRVPGRRPTASPRSSRRSSSTARAARPPTCCRRSPASRSRSSTPSSASTSTSGSRPTPARSSCRPAGSTTSPSSRSPPTLRRRTRRRGPTSRSATTTPASPTRR